MSSVLNGDSEGTGLAGAVGGCGPRPACEAFQVMPGPGGGAWVGVDGRGGEGTTAGPADQSPTCQRGEWGGGRGPIDKFGVFP